MILLLRCCCTRGTCCVRLLSHIAYTTAIHSLGYFKRRVSIKFQQAEQAKHTDAYHIIHSSLRERSGGSLRTSVLEQLLSVSNNNYSLFTGVYYSRKMQQQQAATCSEALAPLFVSRGSAGSSSKQRFYVCVPRRITPNSSSTTYTTRPARTVPRERTSRCCCCCCCSAPVAATLYSLCSSRQLLVQVVDVQTAVAIRTSRYNSSSST